jgi:hypothetical protein
MEFIFSHNLYHFEEPNIVNHLHYHYKYHLNNREL